MKGSLRIARFAGIDVFIHWTFWLLIAWIALSTIGSGAGLSAAAAMVAFVLALFGCVVLHEFGHALAARRYGIPTRDITLLPIGGVARLARMPERPRQELVVAIAGPAVNAAIAAVLYLSLRFTTGVVAPADLSLGQSFFSNLMWVNVALIVFNMLPAFPMDGGRVLRALLAIFAGHERATHIAATLGQVLAGIMAVAGLFGNPMLLLIGAFIFFGAAGEAKIARVRRQVRGLRAHDGMITRFAVLPAYISVNSAAGQALSTGQRDFPVVQDGQLLGMLRRADLLAALESGRGQAPIIETMRTDFIQVRADLPLFDALQRASETSSDTLAVMENRRLVGLLDTAAAVEIGSTRMRLHTAGETIIMAEAVGPSNDLARNS